MRAYLVAVRGFNFKLVNYQKVISAPFSFLACLEVAEKFVGVGGGGTCGYCV